MRPLARFLSAGVALAVILASLGGCGGSSSSGNSDSSESSGTTSQAAAAKSAKTGANAGPPTKDWAYFGRVPQRTHYLAEPIRDLDPPLQEAWSINTHALIEYPPALADGVAYLVNKYGNTSAVRLSDHKILWRHVNRRRQHGPPVDVTGPVYHGGRVYYAALDGYLLSLDSSNGHVVWSRDLHAHLESSPLVVGKTLYIGTDDAQLLALDTADGRTRWHFKAPGAIKSSPSFDDGKVFVADYESSMFALDAATGKPVWRTNTSKVAPFGKGGFYSSPSIAFGHAYAARDDGTVFAFDKGTGKVAWSFPAGGFIYGSPAAARVPGTRPSVYIGSENGRFFALDARTGKPRWHYDVGGPVPGTASVVGNTVFTSSFKTRKSIGIDVHTHKLDFELDTAGYSPVISDGRRLYVTGYYTLVGLEPKAAPR